MISQRRRRVGEVVVWGSTAAAAAALWSDRLRGAGRYILICTVLVDALCTSFCRSDIS